MPLLFMKCVINSFKIKSPFLSVNYLTLFLDYSDYAGAIEAKFESSLGKYFYSGSNFLNVLF